MLPIESVIIIVGDRTHYYSSMERAHKLIELNPTVNHNCIIRLVFPFRITAEITVEQFYNLVEYSLSYLMMN